MQPKHLRILLWNLIKIIETNSTEIDISFRLYIPRASSYHHVYNFLSVCEFRMKDEENKDGVIPVHFRFRLMFLINEYALYT